MAGHGTLLTIEAKAQFARIFHAARPRLFMLEHRGGALLAATSLLPTRANPGRLQLIQPKRKPLQVIVLDDATFL